MGDRVGPRRTYGYARRVGRFGAQVFLGISIWFFCLLQGIGLLSKLQKVSIFDAEVLSSGCGAGGQAMPALTATNQHDGRTRSGSLRRR